MKTTTLNNSISIDKTLANLLFYYIVSVLFTYPYGIPIVGDNYARIPDLFALAMGGFAMIVWSLHGKSKFKLQPFLPLIPFFILEVILPIIGASYYGSLSNSLSGIRVILLYFPVAICCSWLSITSTLKLDRRIDKLLRIATIANLMYGTIQMGVYIGIFPRALLISTNLEIFIADAHFNELIGLRIAGFFTNTTALSVFGIVAMSYFLSKYKAYEKSYYLVYSMLALMLVFLSTSRAAYVGAALIILFNILSSNFSKSIKTIVIITVAVCLLLIILSFYLQINYEEFFYRFIRIKEDGLQADYSWKTRVEEIWPTVLRGMRRYPWGTLIPSYKIFGFIDSGYLTYYSQGSWLFISGLCWFYISTLFSLFKAKIMKKGWSANFLCCLFVYIAFAMVVNNPMRSPIIVFVLMYGFWLLSIEKKLINKRFSIR